jgi:tetratricopeptide (TPR) repeat protein
VLLAGTGSAEPSEKTASEWRKTAEAHLRAGEKRQAAEAYEQLIRQAPSARIQLAPMLARLYAETKASDKALGWAKVAMERSPDPRAYLAGIHLALGQNVQAQSILAEELAKSNAPPRTVSLSWQLADLQLQQGETNAALATLEKATQSVKGTSESAKAEKRLQKLKREANHEAP